jgi:AbrB family looped-hinge helix DNA binding protein
VPGHQSAVRRALDAARVRRYFTEVKTTVSTKGQIVLPAEIRERDGVEPGQQFEIERIDRGEYRLHPPECRRFQARRREGR